MLGSDVNGMPLSRDGDVVLMMCGSADRLQTETRSPEVSQLFRKASVFLCFYICRPFNELCQDAEYGQYPLLFRVDKKELRLKRQNQKRRRN